jgi:acyl dehydratase
VSSRPAASRTPEEIVLGTHEAIGQWTVSREEIIAFATTWDPLPFHVDEELARATTMGGLIASGVHTLGILQRLTVDAIWSRFTQVIGRSMGEMRMLQPVRPDDTLTGSLEWTRVEPRSRGRVVVGFIGRLRNQRGELAFELTGEVVIPATGEVVIPAAES